MKQAATIVSQASPAYLVSEYKSDLRFQVKPSFFMG